MACLKLSSTTGSSPTSTLLSPPSPVLPCASTPLPLVSASVRSSSPFRLHPRTPFSSSSDSTALPAWSQHSRSQRQTLCQRMRRNSFGASANATPSLETASDGRALTRSNTVAAAWSAAPATPGQCWPCAW
eukprot:11399-Rhodomonas_salina.1